MRPSGKICNLFLKFRFVSLTLEHEKELLRTAAFVIEKVIADSATIIIASKGYWYCGGDVFGEQIEIR